MRGRHQIVEVYASGSGHQVEGVLRYFGLKGISVYRVRSDTPEARPIVGLVQKFFSHQPVRQHHLDSITAIVEVGEGWVPKNVVWVAYGPPDIIEFGFALKKFFADPEGLAGEFPVATTKPQVPVDPIVGQIGPDEVGPSTMNSVERAIRRDMMGT